MARGIGVSRRWSVRLPFTVAYDAGRSPWARRRNRPFGVPGPCRARVGVEDGVRAVAVFGRGAAALHFEDVDVLRIELRPDVAGDVRVRHRHAVDEPSDLVPAAHVQLIVDDVRAGDELG